jgi:soluble lytic murein transglycosylase-like protein
MSIEAVAGRMAEIQALLQTATAGPAPLAPVGEHGNFAATLATAQAGTTVPAADAATATTAADGAALADGSAAPAVTAAPAGVPTGGDDGGQYAPMIQEAARRHGIDPQVFTNLVRQESGFDPDAGSSAGAQGLTQLMPATAKSLGVSDVHDPAQALEGGAKYLRQQLDTFGGDYTKALAAYNAGPGAVQRYGGVPPYAETQHYVSTILGTGASA